jgi:hypothetical protein
MPVVASLRYVQVDILLGLGRVARFRDSDLALAPASHRLHVVRGNLNAVDIEGFPNVVLKLEGHDIPPYIRRAGISE